MRIESNFDVIRRHQFGDEHIELNDQQQKMCDRWNAVIEMKTCDMLSNADIVIKLIENFGISRAKAYNDIGNAEALFGYSTPLNKRFQIGARIYFLQEKINMLYGAKEYDNAVKLEMALAKYLDMYPDLKKQERPQNLFFTYSGNKPLTDEIMPTNEAEYILLDAANNG